MNWEDILKINNEATKFVANWLLENKRVTMKHEIDAQRMLHEKFRNGDWKEAIRTAFESVIAQYKNILQYDPLLVKELKERGLSFDDVDWDEATVGIRALLDETLDG